MLKVLAAGLLACASLSSMALAQEPQQKGAAAQADSINFIRSIEAKQFRSSNLVGKTVFNLQDEEIGSISDLILDGSGRVAGVIIGVGGFLGLGQSDVAVPMASLKFERDEQAGTSTSGDTSAAGADKSAAPGGSAEKQSGSAEQPSGTSTNAALPSQDTKDEGNAAKNAAEGAPRAKQDPAQTADAKAAVSETGQQQTGQQQMETKESQSGGGTSGSAGSNSKDADWLADMKVVLNTTRQDLQDAPKLGESETENKSGDQPARP